VLHFIDVLAQFLRQPGLLLHSSQVCCLGYVHQVLQHVLILVDWLMHMLLLTHRLLLMLDFMLLLLL
jgi:hypothetical protein